MDAPSATVTAHSQPGWASGRGKKLHESKPGDREISVVLPASDTPRMVATASENLPRGTGRIYVDGELVASTVSSAGSGGYGNELELAPGEPHTVTVRLQREPRAGSRLGIVVSTLVK